MASRRVPTLVLVVAALVVGGFVLHLAVAFGAGSVFAFAVLMGAAPGVVSAALSGRWAIDQINVQRLLGVVAVAVGVYLILAGQVTLHTWVLAGVWAVGWGIQERLWVVAQKDAEKARERGVSDV